jgi:hypothetical protein
VAPAETGKFQPSLSRGQEVLLRLILAIVGAIAMVGMGLLFGDYKQTKVRPENLRNKAFLKNFFDFGLQRSKKEAAVFYFVFLLLGSVISWIIGFLQPPFTTSRSELVHLSYLASIIYVFVIGLWILLNKAQVNFLSLMIVGSGLVLTYWVGPILGLIPIAYLTTLPKNT